MKKRILSCVLSLTLILSQYSLPFAFAEEMVRDSIVQDAEVSTEASEEQEDIQESGDESVIEESAEEEAADISTEEKMADTEEETPSTASAVEEETEAKLEVQSDYITLDYFADALLPGHGSISADHTIVTASDNSALILLSLVHPKEYQNMTIVAPTGDSFDVQSSNKVKVGGESVSYQGLGSEEYPFRGKIQAGTIKTDHAVFRALSDTSMETTQTIEWYGSSESVIAEMLILEDSTKQSHELKINVKAQSSMGSLFGVIQAGKQDAEGQISIGSANLNLNGKDINVVYDGKDAGLICGTLKNGHVVLKGLDISSAANYKVTGVNAGGLIGSMCQGTSLTIQGNMTLPVTEINGTAAAGGIVGRAEDATITVEQGKTVSWKVDAVKGTNVGGMYGEYRATTATASPVAGFSQSSSSGEIKLYSNDNGYAGGFFGCLQLSGHSEVRITESVRSSLHRGGSHVCYGGVTGSFEGDEKSSQSELLSIEAPPTGNPLEISSNNIVYAKYYGGIAGRVVSNGCLSADQVRAVCKNAVKSNTASVLFGGIAAKLEKGCMLNVKDIAVSAAGETILLGGGVVGEAMSGSSVRLTGTTDLRAVSFSHTTVTGSHYDSNRYSYTNYQGQIIGKQESSLIYGESDWNLIRSTSSSKFFDDIGNYGQVIRKTETNPIACIAYDGTKHKTSLVKPEGILNQAGSYAVDDVNDFAYIAISWQTRGIFGESIPTDCTIQINQDIDLTHTGITGISRDLRQDKQELDEYAFTGCIKGIKNGENIPKITLAIGEAYGTVGSVASTRDGAVIGHNSLGLFAVFAGTAEDLEIGGSIRIYSRNNIRMSVGALAAYVTGNAVVKNVTVSPEISVNADSNPYFQLWLRIGGLFGTAEDWNQLAKITLDASCVPNITVQRSFTSYIHVGSVIGDVIDDSARRIAISVDNVTAGGTITSTAQSSDSGAYVGGLIANIISDETDTTPNTIEIKKLALNLNITSKAQKWTGGLLGGIWANTEVTMKGSAQQYAVSGTGSITAEQSNEIGGLCYRASGKWDLQDYAVDMSQFTLTASKANAMGLLVCHGEPWKEELDSQTARNVGGLYLLLSNHWETAYHLTGITLTAGGEIFDEFVAYTAERDRTAASPAYNIMGEGSGVISLKTEGEHPTLNMGGQDSNTYQNRTEYGKTVKTNGFSRYYYNLDTEAAKITEKNGYVDTPQELLLWSVYRYCFKQLSRYFAFADVGGTVGSASPNAHAGFDMKGLSYYPVDINNENLSVRYADFTFYNDKIEGNESQTQDKKLTSAASQHQAMHCGFLHNYADLTSKEAKTITLSIIGVRFAGVVGRLPDGGSGAFICGSISGRYEDGIMVTSRVNVGDSASKEKAVVLSGIRVREGGQEGYCPVLINRIGSYTEINTNYVCWEEEHYQNADNTLSLAGTSLYGEVGGEKEHNISLSFQGIIELPSKKKHTIFTHATLLESFRYQSVGEASYNFLKEKDWDGDNHLYHVTYGMEITSSYEFAGLEKYYFDDSNPRLPVYADTKDAENGSDFSKDYLPYVSKSPANHGNPEQYTTDDGYHEIKVNIRTEIKAEGCGTFGDPYVISDADSLAAYARISSTGNGIENLVVTVVNTSKINELHNQKANPASYHVSYLFAENNWYKLDNNGQKTTTKLEPKEMQYYFCNAYYQLREGNYTISGFSGFGSSSVPFRGMIAGAGPSTQITLTGTSKPLIPISYGSIVYNLTLRYEGSQELTKEEEVSIGEKDYTHYGKLSPETEQTFGCIFGSVFGGDNFIDGVTVTASGNNIKLDNSNSRAHLLTVGGYIGAISGGGVIFRNMTDTSGVSHLAEDINSSAETEAGKGFLYINPYIGRVLDGYALYETDQSAPVTLHNTDKNYQIANINPAYDSSSADASITVNGNVLSVDQQGLLILAALVNSGGANGVNNAYHSTSAGNKNGYYYGNLLKGKVRNEDYTKIGTVGTDDQTVSATENNVLAQLVRNDNFIAANAVGNTRNKTGSLAYSNLYHVSLNVPYLAYRYMKAFKTTELTTENGASIVLTSDIDYREIGNGWRGLNGRYTCNATFKGNSLVINSGDFNSNAVLMTLTSFNGGSHTLSVTNQLFEYADDDFHIASVGGFINILRVKDKSGGLNQVLAEKLKVTQSVISLTYINAKGEEQIQSSNLSFRDGKYTVSVGAVFGLNAGTGSNDIKNSYVLKELSVTDSTIAGPYIAGGIFGAVGFGTSGSGNTVIGYPGMLVSRKTNNHFGANMVDCSFADIRVTAGLIAGGLIGDIAGNNTNNLPREAGGNSGNLVSSYTASSKDFVVGSSSEIKTTQLESVAGGMIGIAGTTSYINDLDFYAKNISSSQSIAESSIIIQDVSVSANPDSKMDRMWIRRGPDDGNKDAMKDNKAGLRDQEVAAGVIGRAGGKNVYHSYHNITLRGTNDKVNISVGTENTKNTSIYGFDNGIKGYAGGFGGYFDTAESNIIIDGFVMENINLTGLTYSAGVLALTGTNHRTTNYVLDHIEVKDSVINSKSYSGGILGNYSMCVSASNLFLNHTSITTSQSNKASSNTGVIAGKDDRRDYYGFYIAGLCVKADETVVVPENEIGGGNKYDSDSFNSDSKSGIKRYGYVSYTDYPCVQDNTEGNAPYVTTNPGVKLPGISLYGDALGEKNVLKIREDTKQNIAKKQKTGYYTGRSAKETAYTGTNYLTNELLITDAMLSSYRTEQTDTKYALNQGSDFQVLTLSGENLAKSNDIIQQYLNIITNDGFAQALGQDDDSANRNLVDVEVSTYVYDDKQQKFRLDQTEESGKPSLKYENNCFTATTGYDNTKDRFTLVTVTFYTKKPKSVTNYTNTSFTAAYTVHLPIIVKRTMQVRFEATLSTGMDFYAAGYSSITNHALENIGNPVTAYLTYEYERDLTNEAQKYDWEKFMEEGGSLLDMDKTVIFNDGSGNLLPVGTKLTLVDCQNGNKVYTYTLTEATDSVRMSDFTNGGEHQKSQALSTLLGASVNTAETDVTKKLYVKTDATDGTILIGNQYYRRANEADTGERVAIKFSNERSPAEHYFLLWIVPQNDTTQNLVLDGMIQTKVDSPVASDLHYAHRYDVNSSDNQIGTESTYNISNGYTLSLEDMDNRTQCELSGIETPIKVSLKNCIRFYTDQKFTESDNLYQRFTANLSFTEEGQPITTSNFPNGAGETVSGLVKYYVYTGTGDAKRYYKWNGQKWTVSSNGDAAAAYRWTSNGGDMELLLSTDNTEANAISLASLRQTLLNSQRHEQQTIYVEAEAELYFSEEALKCIPENTQAEGIVEIKNYVQLNYSSQLATKAENLSSSTIQAKPSSSDAQVKYYKAMNNQPKLVLDCDYINQLGINGSDLEPMYYAEHNGKNTSYIEMQAEYDLGSVPHLESVLAESTGVTFTLSLQKQTGTGLGGYQQVQNSSDYIDFVCNQPKASAVWSWTIPKSQYANDAGIVTSEIFNGEKFIVPMTAYVNTDIVDFANYKIVLTAVVEGTNGVGTTDATEAYLIYTYAKISPVFVTASDK